MRILSALREFDWKGWLGWMMATLAGLQLVVFTIWFSFKADLVDHWWGGLAMYSVAGISLGACQWIWLRRRLVKAWQWIVATLLGWYLAVFLAAAFLVRVFDLLDHSNLPEALEGLVLIIVLLPLSLAFSLPQWFLIRRQVQKSAWWWLVARPFAWLAGIGLITLGDRLGILPNFPWSYDMSSLAVLSLLASSFGFGFAAVTGATFTWIQTNHTVVRNHGDQQVEAAHFV